MKILHCPTNIGSHPSTLAQYERKIGLESDSFSYSLNVRFSDSTNYILGNKNKSTLLSEIQGWKFLVSKATKYDIIHYNFGSSIIPVKKLEDPFNPKYPDLIINIFKAYSKFFDLRELFWMKN